MALALALVGKAMRLAPALALTLLKVVGTRTGRSRNPSAVAHIGVGEELTVVDVDHILAFEGLLALAFRLVVTLVALHDAFRKRPHLGIMFGHTFQDTMVVVMIMMMVSVRMHNARRARGCA